MKRLQDFSFNKSQYDRPNQKKVCGWSVFGKPCQVGPDANGKCQAQYECVPYRDGDRWRCTRPASAGGKCRQGPTSAGLCRHPVPRCVPLDSVRTKRGKLVVWSFFAAMALLLFILAAPWRSSFFSAGEVTAAHAQLAEQCDSCHVSAVDRPQGWLLSAFSGGDVNASNQKCRHCHDMGYDDSRPHGMSAGALALITERELKANNGERDFRLFAPAATQGRPLACSSCHREHRGVSHDLRQMDSARCVSCHVRKHMAFSKQHPQFSQYPFARRSAIIFDHLAHHNDYFQKKELLIHAPQACAACHEKTTDGQNMTAPRFEQGCAGCHGKDVTGERLEEKGFAVFALPAIDIKTLKQNGLNIGEWPRDMEDEEMPLLMQLMLSATSDTKSLLQQIAAGELLLNDLSGQPMQVLRAVQALVWEIKILLYELVTEGHPVWRARLQHALSVDDQRLLNAATAGLPPDLLRTLQQNMLPSLAKEVESYRKQPERPMVTRTVAVAQNEQDEVAAEDKVAAGGWYVQDLALYYRPTGHGDELLHTLIDVTSPGSDQFSLKAQIFAQLTSEKHPGQCGKCHSVEQVDKQLVMQWQSLNDAANLQPGFTHFSHKPHVYMQQKQTCQGCHQLDMQADILKNYRSYKAEVVQSNWKSIPKEVCAQCHNENRGEQPCQLCHNYHTGYSNAAAGRQSGDMISVENF